MNKLSLRISLIALSFAISLSGVSQSPHSHSEEYSLLGLHLLLADYNKPYFNHFNAGYQLSYFDKLSERLDFMVQGGSISSENAFKNSNKNNQLIHYLSASALLPLSNNRKPITPFVSAGTGINFHNPYFVPFLLPGIGFRIRLAKNTYLHTQANYELSLNRRMNNSVQLNIGILGALFKNKKTTLSIPVNHEESTPAFIDTDGDGTPDYADSCVSLPGPRAFNGCPDSDGDGIPDHKDKCPTIAGHASNNGCPVSINAQRPNIGNSNKGSVINEETQKRLNLIASNIHFDVNKAELTTSTQNSLKELLLILQTNSTLLLTVGGHTDNTGNEWQNQALSEARASAVAKYIIANGVNPNRVKSFGYGDSRPIADNRTKEGKAANRRTELTLHYP